MNDTLSAPGFRAGRLMDNSKTWTAVVDQLDAMLRKRPGN